jgi:uncharacterized Tic20 family protein
MSFETPPPPPPPNYPGPTSPNENNLMVLAHAGTLISFLTGGFGFLVPLILLLTKGKESDRIRGACIESLNFQISVLIYSVISLVLMLLLVGFLLILVVGVVAFIFPIIAAVRVSSGMEYKYPLTLRLLK